MQMMNIVLVGFMGSGKSASAKLLGEYLNREVLSTDEIIEAREGSSVFTIFEKKGEAYFRRLEHNIVKEISAKEGFVVDCGGGVVLNPVVCATTLLRLQLRNALERAPEERVRQLGVLRAHP